MHLSKIRIVALGIFVAAAFATGSAQAAAKIQKVVSESGIKAWLVEDRTVPIIAFNAHFRGGAALDPDGLEGLASFTSSTMDEGAGDLDSIAFQTRLRDLNVSLSFSANRDGFSADLRTLAENRDAAFAMLKVALNSPRFDPEPVERIRGQIVQGLERDKTNPRLIAGRTFFSTVYAGHPYGRPTGGTVETISAITRADLAAFARRELTRDRLVIGVAGAISAEELKNLLDDTFSGLPATGAPINIPDIEPASIGKTLVVSLPVPQSSVIFGHGGLARDDDDFLAAYVLNYILGGGGFSSRLVIEVREKRGLAYSVYSYLYPLDHGALYLGGVGTRNARVAESLRIIRDELKRIGADGVSAAELADAKTYLTGAYPLRFDTNDKIAGILVGLQREDLGADYPDRRNSLIEAVTSEDLARVARRLIGDGELLTVVVGQPEGLEDAEMVESR